MFSFNTTEGLLESIKSKRYILFHFPSPIQRYIDINDKHPSENIVIKSITVQSTEKVIDDITIVIKVNGQFEKTIILSKENDFIVVSTNIRLHTTDAMTVDIVHGFSPGKLTVKADF